MENKHIKELMSAMVRTGTKRLKIKKEDFELELERQENGIVSDPIVEGPEEIMARHDSALRKGSQSLLRSRDSSYTQPSLMQQASAGNVNEEVAGVYVTSPMVGTFYATPSPDDPSFVKIGDKIEKDTVVCIIEAMKVMNEVKAGVSGTVSEVLVENGQPVEFGTKLFRIT